MLHLNGTKEDADGCSFHGQALIVTQFLVPQPLHTTLSQNRGCSNSSASVLLPGFYLGTDIWGGKWQEESVS